MFETADEHALVLVPRTRRVQIRLCYVVPLADRVQAAARLARWLEELAQEAS